MSSTLTRKPMKRGARLRRTPFQSQRPAPMPRNYGGLKRDARKALGTAKPKEGSQRDLEQKLESLLAKRVKMRDGYQCCQCRFDSAPTVGLLDAGHIYPKGKFPSGKFLVENVVGQCRRHNQIHIGRPEFMFIWYEAENGEGSLSKLHALVLAQPRRQSNEWLTRAIEECEEAIADMELLAVA